MTDRPWAPSAAHKALILLSVCLAAIAMPLTFTGPAVALTAIAETLGGSPVALNWVTNAFMLTFGSALMAAGALADSFGRKRIFLTGVAGFALASLALVGARSILVFDLLRAVQGIAAAAAFAGGMAALAQEFSDAARMRAFSVVGASFGAGLSFGPISSGVMSETFGWPSIFLVVVALTVASFLIGIVVLRESRDPQARGLDWPGAISFTLALTLFTYGMLQAPESGWGDPLVIALLIGAVALMALFVRIELNSPRPMLDLSLFRYGRFVGVQLLAAAPAYAFVVLLILLPIRFVGIEGVGEVAAGRMMMALSAPLLVLPLLAGWLSRWIAPAAICGLGLLVCAAGLAWLSFMPVGGAVSAMLAPMAVIGIGISLPWGLMDGLAVSVVPAERAGMATGIFSTVRVAGEGVALAIVSAVLSALTAGHLAGEQVREGAQKLVTGDVAGAAGALPQLDRPALIQAYGDAFATLLLLLAAITIVTAVVVFVFLGRREAPTRAEAEEAAALSSSL